MTNPVCPNPSDLPAWVQAVGSLVAIAIAIAVPMWQRSAALSDNERAEIRRRKDHRRRITSALMAEIEQAVQASERQQETLRKTLQTIENARAKGLTVKDPGPLNPRSVPISDEIIFRQAATAIGDFPEAVTDWIIRFYSAASAVVRIAEIGGDYEVAAKQIRDLAPRIRMFGEGACQSMRKWRDSGFRDDASVGLSSDELKAAADKVGYPLEDIIKQRGMSL